MSNYSALTRHPVTGTAEVADWIDDYFGRHRYGVLFKSDGRIFWGDLCELVTQDHVVATDSNRCDKMERAAQDALARIDWFYQQGIDDRVTINCVGTVLKDYAALRSAAQANLCECGDLRKAPDEIEAEIDHARKHYKGDAAGKIVRAVYVIRQRTLSASLLPAHDLYETGDADAPDVIKDRNGAVMLGLCRRCNRAEIELSSPCPPQPDPNKYCRNPECSCSPDASAECSLPFPPQPSQGVPEGVVMMPRVLDYETASKLSSVGGYTIEEAVETYGLLTDMLAASAPSAAPKGE